MVGAAFPAAGITPVTVITPSLTVEVELTDFGWSVTGAAVCFLFRIRPTTTTTTMSETATMPMIIWVRLELAGVWRAAATDSRLPVGGGPPERPPFRGFPAGPPADLGPDVFPWATALLCELTDVHGPTFGRPTGRSPQQAQPSDEVKVAVSPGRPDRGQPPRWRTSGRCWH